MISNRARATCYRFQQENWRLLTEHTINDLSAAASNNLQAVASLQDGTALRPPCACTYRVLGHRELETLAKSTLTSIEQGQDEIISRQKNFETQLEAAATNLDTKLTRSLETNEELIDGQRQALNNQQTILEQGLLVESAVNLTRHTLNDVHEEVRPAYKA